MRKTLSIIYIFIICVSFAQEKKLSLPTASIRFTEPQVYHVNDQIFVDIELKNECDEALSFLMAEDKRFSFDFELVTLQNKAIMHRKEYSIFFNRIQPIFNSMVRLNKDEGFTYRLLLNDFYDINTTGQFYLRAIFYPQLKLNTHNNTQQIKSNYITVNIRPKKIEDIYIKERYEIEQEKTLISEKKAPDEVIEYMLDARMNEEWEKFFLYMDLSKMILTNTKFKEKFRRADSEKQAVLIEEYKSYLKQSNIDEISITPVHYEIIRTEYSAGEAKVEARLKFRQYDFYEDKYYTYFLNKKDEKWLINSYTVLNIGTR